MIVASLLHVVKHLQPHRQVLVAFSGGLDSTVLLHQLVCWRQCTPEIKLRAIHVHHDLSANADTWVHHCQQLCEQWQVPLEVIRVTLTADKGLGIEACARQARYHAFRKTLRQGEILATAQHIDDQSETLLLALKRGSGPAGLSAMAVVAPFFDTWLIRPLLSMSRESLIQWAQQHQLKWIEDESNQNDAYERNFLRLRVLPLLKARWPYFSQALARSAALCAEQEQLLDELMAVDLTRLMGNKGQLAITPMVEMNELRRAALLRRWLAQHRALMPSRNHIARIWREVALAKEDASPVLRLGAFEVRRYQKQLWWIKTLPALPDSPLFWNDITLPLPLPAGYGALQLVEGKMLCRPRPNKAVTIRYTTAAAPGLLYIVGRHGGRKLKKIWQEMGIAPWLRNTTPLLFFGETLVAAAGRFVTVEGQCNEGETGLTLQWYNENEH